MANVSAAGTVWNLPNYTGELYLIGANQTPFLNMIGGLQGGSVRTVGDFEFTMAQPYALETAAQPDISETESLTAPTPVSYVTAQDRNTCQIHQKQVSISYAKQSVTGQIRVDEIGALGYGHTDIGEGGSKGGNEKDFQINANLRQIAVDTEYTFLQGTYEQPDAAGDAYRTRGIITGTTTNAVAAGTTDLSKAMIDELTRTMAASGSIFQSPVIFVNALQKQRLTNIYGYAPADFNVGGINIERIKTDFAELGIVWAPYMPTDTLLIADLSVCSPVFLPVPGKGVLFYEELSKTGASEKGQIYGQIGLDYGAEEYHGKITGLTTS